MKNGIKVLIFSPTVTDHMTNKVRLGFLTSPRVERADIAGYVRDGAPIPEGVVKVFGNLASRSYASRLAGHARSVFALAKLLKNYDAVYAWSLDSAFIAFAAKILAFKRGLKFIYGYSDVHNICTKRDGLAPRFARAMEALMAKRADIVVFTSPLFRTEYFGKMLGVKVENFALIENKILPNLAQKMLAGFTPKTSGAPVFGYFGLLTYADAFAFLRKMSAEGLGVLIRGRVRVDGEDVKNLEQYPSFKYGGSYKNPEDMAQMFSQIDASLVIHNFEPQTNYQWQMTNRFYDSLLMRTPIIVQKGTAHADYVRNNDIGAVIDIYEPEKSVDTLKALRAEDFARWRKNIDALPESEYLLGEADYPALIDKLFDGK